MKEYNKRGDLKSFLKLGCVAANKNLRWKFYLFKLKRKRKRKRNQ